MCIPPLFTGTWMNLNALVWSCTRTWATAAALARISPARKLTVISSARNAVAHVLAPETTFSCYGPQVRVMGRYPSFTRTTSPSLGSALTARGPDVGGRSGAYFNRKATIGLGADARVAVGTRLSLEGV